MSASPKKLSHHSKEYLFFLFERLRSDKMWKDPLLCPVGSEKIQFVSLRTEAMHADISKISHLAFPHSISIARALVVMMGEGCEAFIFISLFHFYVLRDEV